MFSRRLIIFLWQDTLHMPSTPSSNCHIQGCFLQLKLIHVVKELLHLSYEFLRIYRLMKSNTNIHKRKAVDLNSDQSSNITKNKQILSELKDENDIDSLFDILKSKKLEKTVTELDTDKPSKVKSQNITKENNHVKNKDPPVRIAAAHGIIHSGSDVIISPDPPVHRYDKESGLPVYKAHLLLVGNGGGTPRCPFDCDCCF
eukprot:gene3501-6968_t